MNTQLDKLEEYFEIRINNAKANKEHIKKNQEKLLKNIQNNAA